MSIPGIQTTVAWVRGDQQFLDGKYSRAHTWTFDGGTRVLASSSPHIVPLPFSVERAVDPEEAFIVSLSSCHMLWFLSIAARNGFRVNEYRDTAIGEMSKNDHGKLFVSVVRLRPYIQWDGDAPKNSTIVEWHNIAHDECFLANSVKTIVLTEPVFSET